VVVKTDQGYFCLDPDEQFVGKSLLEKGSYGLGELAQIKHLITPQSNILIVGAHIGAICIPAAKMCQSIAAIEANPDTYEYLELNVRMNRCTNVKTYNLAANDKAGKIDFVMNTVNSGGSKRMPVFRDVPYFYDNPKIVSIDAARLDDLLAGQDFDLVFMDIEGSEYYALAGMQRILSKCGTLVVEFLPHHLSRVANVTLEQFLEPITRHFPHLVIPSCREFVSGEAIYSALQRLMDTGRGDAGIIFTKIPLRPTGA